MRHALLIASKAGRGHIVRTRALAVALTESGWACQTIAHPGDELPAIATDLVVIDVPTPYTLDIGRRPKLVRIVDTQEATDDNYDLTVFGSAGAEASRTDSMLAGPLYALLRPEFCAERHIARTRSGVQDFRSIGGWSPSELAREMAQHVVAINYGGMRALECACVGTPSIIIPRNEGERLNAHGLMAAGAALIADESEAETMAQSLIEMPALAERMSHNAKALVDGHGVQRVVRAIERLFA